MISDPTIENQLLIRFDFLRHCEKQIYNDFLHRAFFAQLDKGQFICQQGTECAHLGLILSGSARVYKLGETGREITLYRIGPGQSCVLTASCIQSRRPFPAFAVCDQQIDAVLVPASDLHRWMGHSAPWRDYVFGLVADRMANIITLVEDVAFNRVDKRIAAYLLDRTAPGESNLATTHQDIAADLGTSREVVSRILKDLQAQGLIQAARGSIHLDNRAELAIKAKE